ncbi:hypothetical protein BpHYR1_020174 [Brachionus plicatilis]|uniref:Uncharacterized protein n=1 Tax=Brachionus plicatilis TaxID=10195 RepID=A0A3M7QPZ0_BRAPC|nr:hypothetical protein BpHYR1_020174 [Brachionus plicatilis]
MTIDFSINPNMITIFQSNKKNFQLNNNSNNFLILNELTLLKQIRHADQSLDKALADWNGDFSPSFQQLDNLKDLIIFLKKIQRKNLIKLNIICNVFLNLWMGESRIREYLWQLERNKDLFLI